jgi:hypothetical protein
MLLCLQSCGSETVARGSIEGKLVAKIKASCQSEKVCTIRVRDVTNFAWDKMYVFPYTVNREEVEGVVGVPLPEWEEFKRMIIFTNGGKLVYFENDPTNIEHPINEQVVFDIPDRAGHRAYGPDPVFEVTQKDSDKDLYYELKLVQ